MAKKSYIGVDGTARQIKKLYIGDANGKSRKVKKGYIGVGGVARPFIGSGEPEYCGTITELSSARINMASASVGNYALFASGYSGTTYIYTVEAYNSSLVKSTLAPLSDHYAVEGGTIGEYALFAGGYNGKTSVNTVDAYNSSLVKTTASPLSSARSISCTSACAGEYLLFGSGWYESIYDEEPTHNDRVDAYNASLVRVTNRNMANSYTGVKGASVGGYALFAGGSNNGSSYDYVTTFSPSLVRSSATRLTYNVSHHSGASIEGFALFAGGQSYWKTGSFSYARDAVDAYNTSLTKTSAATLPITLLKQAAVSIAGRAIFAGGEVYLNNGTTYPYVSMYDSSLMRKNLTNLSKSRMLATGAAAGEYALIAGGLIGFNTQFDIVDAYYIG